jgi:hypothetical protein
MNFKELMEGAEPKMPGAPKGIQIMTPQQFVAKAGDMAGEEVDEGYPKHQDLSGVSTDKLKAYLAKQSQQSVPGEGSQVKRVQAELQRRSQGVAEGKKNDDNEPFNYEEWKASKVKPRQPRGHKDAEALGKAIDSEQSELRKRKNQDVAEAGNKPVEKSYFGMGDTRTPRDIKSQMRGASDRFVQSTADKDTGPIHSRVAKMQTKMAKSELRKRSDHDRMATGTNEGVAEGYQFKGPFPFDVDHMHGGRGINLPKAETKKYFTDKKQWQRAVDDINSSKYDDNSDYIGVTGRSTVEINGREWARWSDAQQKGYIELSSMSEQGVAEGVAETLPIDDAVKVLRQYGADHFKTTSNELHFYKQGRPFSVDLVMNHDSTRSVTLSSLNSATRGLKGQGVAESLEQLNRIRKLSGLAEATKLPAQTRDLGGQEFQDYMNRIVGTPDVDKKGNVKVDKKGNEKYVSGKTKSDRYKMPYIHRSSVITYIGPDGKTYDEDKIKQTLAIRPKNGLLKQNEKMKHSNGEFEQFFNVGFAALTGIALDQQTNNLIIVNTCPGAGSCKVDCFAMKGSKVQFKPAWQNDGRILTYLLNDPTGFFNQLSAEITKEKNEGKKGNKKFPNGWNITVRWHDAGDFFSPEYLDLALKMAEKHPDVKFYAYTKMASAALAKKPDNFIINWSEGAHTSQEKQIKAADPNLENTKNSRIVPDELFQDLLVKDEKKNLVKGDQGQWQVQPNKLPELKQRLAKEYGLSPSSILNYQEYMAKRKSIPAGMKYNVIVAPGEGDISANDQGVLGTLLLKH